jgi:4-hydroxy-4-methyl-2-oxoglutarate aldolase
MFDIRPMPTMLPDELHKSALLAAPATIGHIRYLGFPDAAIRPLGAARRIAGTAVTLAIPGMDSALLHHTADVLRPGHVLLIDRLGDTHYACLGGGVALVLMKAGIEGAILDGPCADPGEIEAAGLPLWARGVSSITTRVLGLGGALNVPICVGGAVIMPGDLVIADVGGIVVLPPTEAQAVIERAVAMQDAEGPFLARVGRGEKLADISGANARISAAESQRRG